MTNPPSYDDDSTDPLAARLRAALNSEADMVNPSDDGLQQIRHGVESTRRPWWRHPAAPALAAAAVLGLMAGGIAVVFGSDDDGKDGSVIAGDTSSTSTSASPSPSETPSASDASPSSTTTPVESDVYVYYVMDDGGTARLYRERRLNPGAGPVEAALETLISEPARDPDYSSPWDGSELLDYSVKGDTAVVDVAGSKTGQTPIGMQQLVYTVTANDPAVEKVRVLIDGRAAAEPITRAPMLDVQGLVWLLGPSEGESVPSPVKITGYGTAFEGTVSWEVRRQGAEKVVAEGFTQAGANGEFDEFNDSVKLDPGTYEMRAFESSAEDGRPVHVDSKTFTVE